LQRPEVDAAEPVERVALGGRVQQRLVGVLAVEVDELGADRRELAGRCQPPVDVGAAPARAGNGAREDDLVAGVGAAVARAIARGIGRPHESALDPRLVGARPHQHRVGASPHQQLDGVDDKRLAGAGLAGERRHPWAEHEAQLGNDPEIADGQFEDHPAT
jgi:hypothetical protein